MTHYIKTGIIVFFCLTIFGILTLFIINFYMYSNQGIKQSLVKELNGKNTNDYFLKHNSLKALNTLADLAEDPKNSAKLRALALQKIYFYAGFNHNFERTQTIVKNILKEDHIPFQIHQWLIHFLKIFPKSELTKLDDSFYNKMFDTRDLRLFYFSYHVLKELQIPIPRKKEIYLILEKKISISMRYYKSETPKKAATELLSKISSSHKEIKK